MRIDEEAPPGDSTSVIVNDDNIGGKFHRLLLQVLLYFVYNANKILSIKDFRSNVWCHRGSTDDTIRHSLNTVQRLIGRQWFAEDRSYTFLGKIIFSPTSSNGPIPSIERQSASRSADPQSNLAEEPPTSDSALARELNARYFPKSEAQRGVNDARRHCVFLGASAPEPRGDFYGRSREIAEMKAFFNAYPARKVILSIEGSPGSGKSQLARQFIEEVSGDYDVVCWIGSSRGAEYWSTSAQQSQDIRIIASQLNIEGAGNLHISAEEISTFLWNTLAKFERRLIVLDNVDSEVSIKPIRYLLKQSHVIVTTVFHSWITGGIDVGKRIALDDRLIDLASGIDFLLARSGRDANSEADSARKVGYVLGWHPLALEQAAAFIAARGIGFQDYLARLVRYPVPLLDAQIGGAYNRSTAITFGVLLDHLRANIPLAFDVLRLASCFAPDAVPVNLFWEDRDIIPFLAAVGFVDYHDYETECLLPLRDFSILMPGIASHRDADIRRIHRVVIHLLRHIDNGKYKFPIRAALPMVLSRCYSNWSDLSCWQKSPWLFSNAVTFVEHMFEEGINLRSEAWRDLPGRLIRVFIHAGDYQSAETIIVRGIDLAEQGLKDATLKHNSKDCTVWQDALYHFYHWRVTLDNACASEVRANGDYAQARYLNEQSLDHAKTAADIMAGMCGPHHISTLTAQRCVGCRYLALGDTEKAVKTIQPALIAREQIIISQLPGGSAYLDNLYRGEQFSLDTRVRNEVSLLSDDHFLAGKAAYLQGEWSLAECHFRKALRCAEASNHTDAFSYSPSSFAFEIARCSLGLADSLIAQGDSAESNALLAKAAQILRTNYLRSYCSIDLPDIRRRLDAPRPLGLDTLIVDSIC